MQRQNRRVDRLVAGALGVMLVWATGCAEQDGVQPSAVPATAAAQSPQTRGAPPPPPPQAHVAATTDLSARERVARLDWGEGATRLGRIRPAEANPEAPMAIAGDAAGQLWILDQLQDRVVLLAEGKLGRSVPVPLRAAEDLALHGDLLLVLDRLVDGAVVALDKGDGAERWRLPVVQADSTSGSGVSGLFVHDGGIWLEWGHVRTMRIGGLDGSHDPKLAALPTLPGRPARDGRLALAARRAGPLQVLLTGHDTAASRAEALPPSWTAAARFERPVLAIRALDSDAWGRVWLAVATFVEEADGTVLDEHLEVLRFGRDGKLQGRQPATLEAGPEEQMRTFSVGLDGSLWHLARQADGALIERWAP